MKKILVSERIFIWMNNIILTVLTFIAVYPLIHVAFASFSTGAELMAHAGLLYKPLGFTLDGYKAVFETHSIFSGYRNTLIIIIVGVMDNLVLTVFGAYGLSRKSLRYRKVIMLFIIFTMYFSGGLIPTYLNVKSFGFINSLWAVIIPVSINTFNLILMRTSFEAIPESLEESAKMDGANDFVVLFKIIIPLSMPVITVMSLYYGVAHWNSWFNAMLFLRDRELYPLQLVLREILFLSQQASSSASDMGDFALNVSETLKYSLIIVATVPILCVYPFLQKYFVKGVMIGAIKG